MNVCRDLLEEHFREIFESEHEERLVEIINEFCRTQKYYIGDLIRSMDCFDEEFKDASPSFIARLLIRTAQECREFLCDDPEWYYPEEDGTLRFLSMYTGNSVYWSIWIDSEDEIITEIIREYEECGTFNLVHDDPEIIKILTEEVQI